MEINTKRAIRACDECKRRKRKCYGDSPCVWCLTNELECVFSVQPNSLKNKRERENTQKKQRGLEAESINNRELDLANTLELTQYLTMYLKYVDPVYTMFDQWDRSTRINLVHPKTPSQKIIKYAACAHIARVVGQRDRATLLYEDAKSLSGQAFDDISADGLLSFLLLGDDIMGAHYTNNALSMFKIMAQGGIPANIRHVMTNVSILSSVGIDNCEKIQASYLGLSNDIENPNTLQALMASIYRLCIKATGHAKQCTISAMRVDIFSAVTCKVIFSEVQRKNLLEDLHNCRQIASVCTEIQADPILKKAVDITLTTYEILVEWRSGNSAIALPLAINYANECTLEIIRFSNPARMRFGIEKMLIVSIFLYEQGYPALATKLQQLAQSFSTLICERIPPLESTIQGIVGYMCSLTPTKPSPLVLNSINTSVKSVVSHINEQIQPFDQGSILSASTLHMIFRILCTYLPPTFSPLDVSDHRITAYDLSSFVPSPSSPSSSIPQNPPEYFISTDQGTNSLSSSIVEDNPLLYPPTSESTTVSQTPTLEEATILSNYHPFFNLQVSSESYSSSPNELEELTNNHVDLNWLQEYLDPNVL